MDGSDIGALSDVRIGRIIAVSASQAVALLERCDPSRASERDWPVEMGALVKMQTRVSTVYGMVSGLRVPLPNLSPSDQELKVIELELAGETLREENGEQGAFRRGVSAHPALDEPVYLASPADLAQVYARPSVATARIGTLHQDSAVPAYILTNELFGKHFSIVGTTGSGKSCVVATILSAVIERNPNAHVMLIDPHGEYAAAFGGQRLTVRDELTAIIAQLLRIPVDGKPITILDVSGIPSEVLNVVVSVLCRLTFDFALWSDSPVPVTIVCEEAHRYAPRDTGLGFEPAKRALSRIAKEGRKYGVSLCVVTQRPSDLAPGLLSECNTIFALRMTNHDDQEIVRGAVPEASHGLMNFLPALRNGEAIAAGEGVSMPMRVCFDMLPDDHRPKSATASFTGSWSEETEGSHVDRAVERWRRGVRNAAA